MEEMNVVYIKNKRVGDLFDYLFHFKARKIENGYIIMDVLGTGKTRYVKEQYFADNFILISDEEFEEYKQLLCEGDSKKINEYWKHLEEKIKFKYTQNVDNITRFVDKC